MATKKANVMGGSSSRLALKVSNGRSGQETSNSIAETLAAGEDAKPVQLEKQRQTTKDTRKNKPQIKLRKLASIELAPVAVNSLDRRSSQQMEDTFGNGSKIKVNEQMLNDSSCMSLAQLHMMLGESEDLSINRNLSRIEKLAAEVAKCVEVPCKALEQLLDLARQVCLDNLRLVQQALNTEENNGVLRQRTEEFGKVVQEERNKAQKARQQAQTLWKTINEQEKQKKSLLNIINQFERETERRHDAQISLSASVSPMASPKDGPIVRDFENSPGFLNEDHSVQPTEIHTHLRRGSHHRQGSETHLRKEFKPSKWTLKIEPREPAQNKIPLGKSLVTLKSKLRQT